MREPLDLDKLLASWPRERRILFCDEAGNAPPIGMTALLPLGVSSWVTTVWIVVMVLVWSVGESLPAVLFTTTPITTAVPLASGGGVAPLSVPLTVPWPVKLPIVACECGAVPEGRRMPLHQRYFHLLHLLLF